MTQMSSARELLPVKMRAARKNMHKADVHGSMSPKKEMSKRMNHLLPEKSKDAPGASSSSLGFDDGNNNSLMKSTTVGSVTDSMLQQVPSHGNSTLGRKKAP